MVSFSNIRMACFVLIVSFRLFYSSAAHAQSSLAYEIMWKGVDSLMQIQQPESALKRMEAIYRKSVSDGDQIQQIKAFVGIRYAKINSDEESFQSSINAWEKEKDLLQPANQSVLLAYKGDFMISLLNRDRGEIFGRTKGAAQPDDIVTWDLEYFKNRIDSCFILALSNHELLSKISSRTYAALTDTGELAWNYRPTLLDLVASKALEFYRNDGLDSSPVPFSWAQDAPIFSDSIIIQPVTGRYDRRVFDLFSLLGKYHRENNEMDALLHLQLDRMDYIYQHSLFRSKDELYTDALKLFGESIADHPFKAVVLEKLADVLTGIASQYDPSIPASEIYRMKLSEAAGLYEEVIRHYPGSPAGRRSANKLSQLKSPFLQVNVENITRKGFPFAVLANYKNLDIIKARLSRINHSEYLESLKSDSYYGPDYPYKSLTFVSGHEFKLVPDADLRQHTTELLFPKLNAGLYRLEFTGITGRDTCSSVALFTVSGISFNERDGIVNVMDIENGLPVKGAAIEIFRKSGKEWVASKNGTSAMGRKKPAEGNNLLRVTSKDDTLTSRWYFSTLREPASIRADRLYLFTDRSIYRPGQTLFFKGILINSDRADARAVEDRSVEVILKNSNDQSLDTLILKTNRYGTVSGKFSLPAGGLPGNFRLVSTWGETGFRVEEYRRPGFKIEIDDLKGEYRLNSQVDVSGKVVSFSGVPLKNVTGRFTVLRIPLWILRMWGEPELIARGTFTTDEEGKYRFAFLAKQDEKFSHQQMFSSRFEIQSEVTDITGETQEATKAVSISREALTATLSGPAVVDLGKLSKKELKLTFDVRNSDNQAIHSTGKIELIHLESPARPLRKRLWVTPDRPIYSKAQWEQLYPGNQYGETIQPLSYPGEQVIRAVDFNRGKQQEASLNTAGLVPGYYKARLTTKDKYGTDVRAEHLIRVYNSSKKVFSFPENSWIQLSGREDTRDENSGLLSGYYDPDFSVSSVLPGESIELLLGNYDTQYWKVLVVHGNDTVALYNKLIDRSMARITIPVLAAHQGGLIISASSISQGRKIDKVFRVEVPWIQKTLNVSVEKFPVKGIPGNEIGWNIKVADSNDQPVKAEIAGVVYDASLDKILPHSWQLKIWENLNTYHGLRFPQEIEFGSGQCTQFPWLTELPEVLPVLRKMSDYGEPVNDGVFYIRGTSTSGRKSESSMVTGYGNLKKAPLPGISLESADMTRQDSELEDLSVKMRSDFRETAWFDAHLETDENGKATVGFQLPESVTEWKFMAMAHTSEGLSGTVSRTFIAQKPLMVEPFPTRFVTAGDVVVLPVKVTNLSGKKMDVDLLMELSHVDSDFKTAVVTRRGKLMLADGESRSVDWKLAVPADAGNYRISVTARGGEYSDGYESFLPVEPDRRWITETKAFTVRPNESFELKFSQVGGLRQMNEGKWTLNLMTNPIGMITDALPQLTDAGSTTITGTVSKLTGVLILRKILADHPVFAAELEMQRRKLLTSPDSFKTRLEKGEQFTNLRLNETPWLRDSDYERKKLSMFNADSIKANIKDAITRLVKAQLPDGGFAWCPGMESSEWITSQVLYDIARIKSQNLLNGTENQEISAIAVKAVNYLDQKMLVAYRRLKDKDKINYQPSAQEFDYLYARCTFKEIEFAAGVSEAYNFFLEKASKNWTKSGIWQQVQLAFVLNRESANKPLLAMMMRSFRERATKNDELGMYWKQPRGIFFYREPDIALQAMMIELFREVHAAPDDIDAMKQWMLQQKRTHAWESEYATARAIYSLIAGEVIIDGHQPLPEIFFNGKLLLPEKSTGLEGSVQVAFDQKDITDDSRLEFRNRGNKILFGGLYHGFFKQVNDTRGSGESMKIRKEIFKLEKTGSGDSLVRVTAGSRPGDLLMVRLLIDNDRDLGFVSLDDQRPAGTEPVGQLSTYEYNGGLWYYRVNNDKGTRFFISHIPKGRFVLEYPLRVSHMGIFTGGRVIIQCAFAPEFGADHSPGIVKLMGDTP